MLAQSQLSSCKSLSVLIPTPCPVLRSATRSLLQVSSTSFSISSVSVVSRCKISPTMASKSKQAELSEEGGSSKLSPTDMDRLAAVGNAVADASGEVIRKYFRKKFEIVDKDDMSFNVVAAGDSDNHQQALESLEWQ